MKCSLLNFTSWRVLKHWQIKGSEQLAMDSCVEPPHPVSPQLWLNCDHCPNPTGTHGHPGEHPLRNVSTHHVLPIGTKRFRKAGNSVGSACPCSLPVSPSLSISLFIFQKSSLAKEDASYPSGDLIPRSSRVGPPYCACHMIVPHKQLPGTSHFSPLGGSAANMKGSSQSSISFSLGIRNIRRIYQDFALYIPPNPLRGTTQL